MTFTKKLLLLWTMIMMHLLSFAQLPCGTEDPITTKRFSKEELENEWQKVNAGTRHMTRTFMIAVHIIRNNNGTMGIGPSEVIDAIETMNKQYIPANIQFELCGAINFINDDTYLETTSGETSILVSKYNLSKVINIYFVPKLLSSSGEQLCGIASLPNVNIGNRRILLANSCVTNGSTLSHEMGHFFGLLHTHSSTGGFEYVERINCYEKGDGFCDTPADPELSPIVVNNCFYIGKDKDPLGVAYKPDPTNLMSYAPKSCRLKFTSEQIAYISLIANEDNDYLYDSCDKADLQLTTIESNEIDLEDFSAFEIPFLIKANQVENPQEVDYEVIALNSQTQVQKVVHSGSFFIDAGTSTLPHKFKLEVTNTIMNAGTIKIKIDTKDDVPEINENNNIITFSINHNYIRGRSSFLFPNPTNDILTYYFDNNIENQLRTSIVDLNGKLVIQTKSYKGEKYYKESINVSELTRGIYILIIELDNKIRDVQKFVKL